MALSPHPFGTDIPFRVVPESMTRKADASYQVQEQIDALHTQHGGGELRFPPGTFRVNLTVYSGISLVGAGCSATVLKSVAGSDEDVIKGADFDTLTGKAYASGDITRGARRVGLRDLTIDGDKTTNLTGGYGIRIWGCDHRWQNLVVQNCRQDGIWTEYTTHGAGTVDDLLEGFFDNIKTSNNVGNGWTFRGPHDSQISNFITVNNDGWGFQSASSSGSYNGTVGGTRWNSWLNDLGSFDFGSSVANLSDCIASGAYVGTGINLGSSTGAGRLTGLLVSGHETGIKLRGSNQTVIGMVQHCRNAANTAGTGVDIDGAANCVVIVTGVANHTAITFTSENGPNIVKGTFNVASGKTLITGTPSTITQVALAQNGGAGNDAYVAEPAPRNQVRTITSTGNVTIRDAVLLADASGGAITAQLPDITNTKGQRHVIKRTSASNNVIVAANGSDTIDGAASKTLGSQYAFVEIVSDDVAWHVIASGGTVT